MPHNSINSTPAVSTPNVQGLTVRPGLEQRSERPTQNASSSLANFGMRQKQWVDRPHQNTGAQPSKRVQPDAHLPPSRHTAGASSDQNTHPQPPQYAAEKLRQLMIKEPHLYLPPSRHTDGTTSGQNAHPQQPNYTAENLRQLTNRQPRLYLPPNHHTAGTSSGQNAHLQQPNSTTAQKPGISLNAKGQPDFLGFTPPALTDLLKSILGQPKQTYQAQHSLENGQDHLLLDQQGSVLHLKQSPTALVVLRSSQAEAPSSALTRDASTFEVHGNNTQIATGGLKSTPLQIPGKAHLAQLTGIHEEKNGEQLRVHEGRLHRFNASTTSWEPKPGSEGKVLSQLSTHGNGAVYGQGDDIFKNLKTFSVASDNVAVCLIHKHDQQDIRLVDVLQEAQLSPSRRLKLNDGKSEALSVGLSNDRLFIADTEGKLYSVGRNELNTGERNLNLAPEQDFQPVGEKFGAGKQVTGFMHGDDGALHILVTDHLGQTHAHPLDEQSKGLKSSWNLTDALVLDNKRGLAGGADPTPANTFDLGPSGRMGITDKRIQQWDPTTQDWKDTGIKDVEQLQRGADNKAYMLKDGKIAKLDVSPHYTPVAVGTGHTLTQTSRSTNVSVGDELPGLENRTVTTFTMLNDKQFAVCDDQNRLTAHHKTGDPSELTHHGLPDKVSSLALDENHNLHALTTQGELFVLAKDDWQAPEARPEANWKPVVTSDNPPRLLASIRTADDGSLSATVRNRSHTQVHLKQGEWQPLIPRPTDHNALNDLFTNVRGSENSKRIPFTGGTLRVAINLMGRSGESSNKSSASEFFRAHIYKNTLEIPRPLKNIGNNIQHHHHGREGLRPIYETESKLFERLDMIHKDSGKAPGAGNDFKSRIARLDLGAPGAGLLTDLEAFRTELEDNSHRAAMHLGHQHGQSKLLRQKEGLLNIHGEVSEPSKRTALSMALSTASEKRNLNSSGHDLLKELQDVLTQFAPSAENHTGALLKTLQDNGMKIAHQKADVPLGQRRDFSDGQALTKSRLTLDVITLKDFGMLLDYAEMPIPPGADNSKKLDQLQQKFNLLRDNTYAEHPIKQITDMGFIDHTSLENSYDAIKAFSKGLKKEDHAISVNLRAATGSKSQAELADKLKASLKQLEHPDDEISLQSGYGVSLSTPFISLAQLGTGPFPSGSVAGGRKYSLKFARGENGIIADLSHAGIGTANAGVGASKNFWPNEPKVDMGNERQLVPAIRLGANLTATATATQHHGVVFTVPDEDIDHFVDNLFSGKLNPLEIMTKGVDHKTQNGMHLSFDLNASGTAELNVGLGITDKNSSPLSVASRIGMGGTVNVNLLNFTDYSLTKSSDKSELREGGMNRARLMNKLDAGVYFRTPLSAAHTAPKNPTDPTKATASQSIAIPLISANLSASADSKTTKRIDLSYTQANPLTTANLSKLSKSLGTAFKDRASQAELSRLANDRQPEFAEATPKEKIQRHLEGLSQYFCDKPVANDEQYAALRALKRSSVQQEAADKKHSMLDSARFESSYTNLSRLSEQGVVSKVMSLVSSMHSPSNAEQVCALLRDDPTLKSLIKQLQSSDGNLARVRLELKDHVQDKIDQGSRSGALSQTALAALLADRDNMRIKAITVFQSASQKEDFTSPLPLLSSNSSAALIVTKTLGKISFSYGENQDTPKKYVLDGELGKPTQSLKSTVGALKKDGFELKS
ncbi:hypothetical protein AB7M29_004855 [Pseudomonas sp. F-14 TE3623]